MRLAIIPLWCGRSKRNNYYESKITFIHVCKRTFADSQLILNCTNRRMATTTTMRFHHLSRYIFVLFVPFLQVSSFQRLLICHRVNSPTTPRRQMIISKKKRVIVLSGDGDDDDDDDERTQLLQHISIMTMIPVTVSSAVFGLLICSGSCTSQIVNAAEVVDPSLVNKEGAITIPTQTIPTTKITSAAPTTSLSSYFGQVFRSPSSLIPAIKPIPTDPKFDNAEARNRAYDEAFEQDARDRDAYYGKMILDKRDAALQTVSRNRQDLGLDGAGDVRLRVGEDKIAGVSSLKEYLLKQDPATLTPAELRVYEQMKDTQ